MINDVIILDMIMAKCSGKKLQRFDFTLSNDDFEEMSKPYVPGL